MAHRSRCPRRTFSRHPADIEKVLILNHPGNPDGLSYDARALGDVAEVIRKHDAWVLSDEIYGLLHHTGDHVSMAAVHPDKTLVTGGLSKWCGAGGWRLGVQILAPGVPATMKEALLAIAAATYSSAPTPVQVAACEAYVYDDATRHHLEIQRAVLAAVEGRISEAIAGSDIAAHRGDGGFYLFLDFTPIRDALAARGVTTDVKLCTQLLEDTGVALLPGSAFNMPADVLTARLAYVDFDGTAVLDDLGSTGQLAPDELGAATERHCGHMLRGMERLVEWLPR